MNRVHANARRVHDPLECRLYLHRIISKVITELARGLNIPKMDHDDVVASPSNRMAKTLLCLWWNERCGVMWLSGPPIPALRTVHVECDSDGAYTLTPTTS
jgi:hypothetical protein